MNGARRIVLAGVLGVLMVGGVIAAPSVALAATADIGFQDQSFTGAAQSPTADKPESKLWFNDGSWWADMFDAGSADWHIFRLDRSSETWIDTGTAVDTRANSSADVLSDGNTLYIGTHVVTVSSNEAPKASVAGKPSRLYRYTYDAATKKYTRDGGFPKQISNNSSESLTIDKDSTGTVWATWTQVSGSSTAGFTSSVYVNDGTNNGTTWGTPQVMPADNTNPNPSPDDISAIVAVGNKVGVLWSNELDFTDYWAVHVDGTARDQWHGGVAVRGNKEADDHLNIKALEADSSGRAWAVVKTSFDELSNPSPTAPQIELLSFKPGTGIGTWTRTAFDTLADCHTRPQLVLDSENQMIYVVATGPSSSTGCPAPGTPGTIYLKSTPMDNPSFAPGRGEPIIRDGTSANVNNATLTKQSVNSTTGLVVLASNFNTKTYWHADRPLGGTTAPVASFTASSTSGPAPLSVQFSDTSTGSPASWSWDFGDGGTADTQNATHVFNSAGSYTVTLTVTNGAGSDTSAATTVTVGSSGSTSTGSIVVGATVSASSASSAGSVVVDRPAGVQAGDVLLAGVTVANNPSVTVAPSGWSTVTAPLSAGTQARVFAYYHVVSDPASEPASYSWTLSHSQPWSAGITDFHGVDTATPFDTAVSTRVQTGTVTSLSVPGVTTVTGGALLVGGVGKHSTTAGTTPPGGWAEAFDENTGQLAELASQSGSAAGATGTATWAFDSGSGSAAGWLTALRPAKTSV